MTYGYLLPCPICKGVEGCDHSRKERLRAHMKRNSTAPDLSRPFDSGGNYDRYEDQQP